MKPNQNCEFCKKELSEEKGEIAHGCLECSGYIYLINDIYVCFHCIKKENARLRAENNYLRIMLNSTYGIAGMVRE